MFAIVIVIRGRRGRWRGQAAGPGGPASRQAARQAGVAELQSAPAKRVLGPMGT